MYKAVIKKILFLFDPEQVHFFIVRILKFLYKKKSIQASIKKYSHIHNIKLQRTLFGVTFPNPVGLAAGFDKNATALNELSMFGFGFIEVGTVTPYAQIGNSRPRLFRLPKDQALINRMGFNNDGVFEVAHRLKKRHKSDVIVGVNIGKNKETLNENAINDYTLCFKHFFHLVDYISINVSSPNTPNLRALQNKNQLEFLLTALSDLNKKQHKPIPILLKISPDLTYSQLDDIIEVIQRVNIAGIIATNTTIERKKLTTNQQLIDNIGPGGLSGKPLHTRSTDIIQYISRKSNNSFPIIAVGGIMSAQDALEKLAAGASLVQIYTGFIYEGPLLVKKINKAILKNL